MRPTTLSRRRFTQSLSAGIGAALAGSPFAAVAGESSNRSTGSDPIL